MKILKSMPQDVAFFERYADLTHTLTKVATIAQIVTGATEIGILCALLSKSLSDILPPQYLTFCSLFGAVFCAALLQIGLKKVFPYSIRAILYSRFKGLDLAFSIGVFVLTIALLIVSIILSWQGSKDIADFAIKDPTTKTTDKADSLKAADIATAQRVFSSDSATIETKFKGKTEAIESEYQSRIAAIERYSNGKQATTQRAELKTKLAKLQSDKAAELEAKATIRQQAFDRAESRNATETATITTDNSEAKAKAKQKQDRYGGYIGYFTAFCYVFFLCVFTLNEIYHKGAKIDLTPIPSQRHFNPSVLAEWFEAVKERIDVKLRTRVYDFANATAAQPLPDAVRALYDFKAKTFDDVLNIEPNFEKTKVVKLPIKRHKLAAIIQDDTKDDTTTKQRQIGFRKTDDTKDDTSKNTDDTEVHNDFRYTVNSNDFGKCENCSKDFFRNHKKQRFCCEDCRKTAWSNKTGKTLDLSIKAKERRKK
ncbi:MAG: hypothetical protein JNL70_21775 [Saprospiraceae bacterium]|nr:hypothetical protein [Saprospiraceae bacterium]